MAKQVKAEGLKAKGDRTESSSTADRPAPTETKQLQTEKMEVHHHPQLEHKPKPWKEYVLEGLMIFLAVFMGFIAENIREHIVEKNRAKEYMKEMVGNLRFDTIRCRVNTMSNVKVIRGFDSLRTELKQAITGHANTNRLYYLGIKYGGDIGQAAFNTSAITELRSSGSLRLISNEKLIASIADYYDRRILAAKNALPEDAEREYGEIEDETFSWIYFDDLIGAEKDQNFKVGYDYNKLLLIKPAPKLLKTSTEDLTRLYNKLCTIEMALKNYDFFLAYVKVAAVPLINSIKKEYNLKDE